MSKSLNLNESRVLDIVKAYPSRAQRTPTLGELWHDGLSGTMTMQVAQRCLHELARRGLVRREHGEAKITWRAA